MFAKFISAATTAIVFSAGTFVGAKYTNTVEAAAAVANDVATEVAVMAFPPAAASTNEIETDPDKVKGFDEKETRKDRDNELAKAAGFQERLDNREIAEETVEGFDPGETEKDRDEAFARAAAYDTRLGNVKVPVAPVIDTAPAPQPETPVEEPEVKDKPEEEEAPAEETYKEAVSTVDYSDGDPMPVRRTMCGATVAASGLEIFKGGAYAVFHDGKVAGYPVYGNAYTTIVKLVRQLDNGNVCVDVIGKGSVHMPFIGMPRFVAS